MNRENAKDYLPLVQALAEGKVIQIARTRGGWLDVDDINSDLDAANYRIKPEPVGPDEVWCFVKDDGRVVGASVSRPTVKSSDEEVIRYRRVEE